MLQLVRDELIARIISPTAARTLAVPTFRQERAVFITGVALTAPDDTQDREPEQWYTVDRERQDVVGIGDPALWGVAPDDWRTLGARHHDPDQAVGLTTQEAASTLVDHWDDVTTGFHTGAAVDPERRRQVDHAARFLTPPALRTWIFACCDDFWTWLRAS